MRHLRILAAMACFGIGGLFLSVAKGLGHAIEWLWPGDDE